jgi:hypothetical protein
MSGSGREQWIITPRKPVSDEERRVNSEILDMKLRTLMDVAKERMEPEHLYAQLMATVGAELQRAYGSGARRVMQEWLDAMR